MPLPYCAKCANTSSGGMTRLSIRRLTKWPEISFPTPRRFPIWQKHPPPIPKPNASCATCLKPAPICWPQSKCKKPPFLKRLKGRSPARLRRLSPASHTVLPCKSGSVASRSARLVAIKLPRSVVRPYAGCWLRITSFPSSTKSMVSVLLVFLMMGI